MPTRQAVWPADLVARHRNALTLEVRFEPAIMSWHAVRVSGCRARRAGASTRLASVPALGYEPH